MIFKYEVIVERRVFCQRITTQGTFKCTLLLRKYLIIFRPYQHEWLIIFISKRDVFFLIRNMMTYIRLRWISFPSLFVLFKVFLWCEFERERVSCKLILWWYAGKPSYNKKKWAKCDGIQARWIFICQIVFHEYGLVKYYIIRDPFFEHAYLHYNIIFRIYLNLCTHEL